MNAAEVITQAVAELEDVLPLPDAETTETLTKRLREIETAYTAVINAKCRYDDRHDDAKVAKKYLEDCQETLITIVGRMTAVQTPLPLFTQAAEEAAQPSEFEATLAASREPAGILEALVAAGYMAVTEGQIACWTSVERDQALGWAKLGGTLESMPAFLQDYAEMEQLETASDQGEEPEPVATPKKSRRRAS